MLDFFINHSIHIVGLLALGIMIYSQAKAFMEKNQMDGKELRWYLRQKLNEVGNEVAAKLVTSIVVAFIISFVSFRELFVTDVFHTVFLTMLLVRPVFNKVSSIFK